MAIQNHFEEQGSDYSKYRPTYPDALAAKLASLCEETRHVLEVGCGTGQLSGILSNYFEKVTATDPSLEQINNATPFDRVNYQQEAAEKISLAGKSVDLIVAAQAAHWFNLSEFYQQAQKVGKDSAVIALISYGVLDIEGTLDVERQINERFQRFYWQEIHHYWPPEREHVENGYQSFEFPFDELVLPASSIQRQWTIAQLVGYIETWSAIRAAKKADKEYIVEQFKRDIALICADSTQIFTLTWPIIGRVGKLHQLNN